jgi:hypothetical protein
MSIRTYIDVFVPEDTQFRYRINPDLNSGQTVVVRIDTGLSLMFDNAKRTTIQRLIDVLSEARDELPEVE